MSQISIVPNSVPPQQKFFNGIFKGYDIIIANPLAVFLLTISTLGILAEYHNKDGPLELFKHALDAFILDTDHNSKFLIAIAKSILGLLVLIIKFKLRFFFIIMISILPIVSSKNSALIVTLILLFYVFITKLEATSIILVIQSVILLFLSEEFTNRLILIAIITYLVYGHKFLSTIITGVIVVDE